MFFSVKSLTFADLHVTSRRDILTYFGKLFSLLAPFPQLLANSFYVLKFYRRVASEVNKDLSSLDRERVIWPSLTRRLAYLEAVCRSRPYFFAVSTTSTVAIVATDASSSGFGASILFDSSRSMRVWGQTWSHDEFGFHINLKEAMAILKTVEKFRICHPVLWLIDNSAVFFALKKGYSASLGLNNLVKKINAYGHFKFCLVKSKANPADFPSRTCIDELFCFGDD